MRITGAAFGIGLVLLSYPGRALAQGTPAPTVAAAKPGDIRVICTAALRFPGDVVAAAERAIGKPIFVEYGSARGNLKDEILNGQDFEVAVLLPDVNDDKLKNSSTVREEVALGPREYEINIYPTSEIVANPELKNLGAVIAPLQVPSILQAVIGKNNNRDDKGSRALIAFLQGLGVDATLKAGSIHKSVVNGTLK